MSSRHTKTECKLRDAHNADVAKLLDKINRVYRMPDTCIYLIDKWSQAAEPINRR